MVHLGLGHRLMAMLPLLFFVSALSFRLATLAISLVHERRLKKDGAIEYGTSNSLWLAIAHLVFYISVITEWLIRKAPLDGLSIFGMALYVTSAIVLVGVICILGRLWTVKLFIARDHVLVQHSLFGVIRHPNYFLNIVPELIGLSFALHAFLTLIVVGILYSIPLAIRIREEERVMKTTFSAYK